MSLDERLLAVIQTLYDTVLEEARWPEALAALSDYTRSEAATFWILDRSEQSLLPTFSYINFDPGFIAEYLDGMAALDPTVRYLVKHPNQPIVHDGLVISEREKDRHPYYDWHGRHSETRFRMVCQVQAAPMVQGGVALHRTGRAGRYESEDLERFSALYPHLRQALSITFRLGSMSAMQQAATEILDRNPAAIVLLDERSRVVYANRSAMALHAAGDGITLSDAGLAASRKQDHDRLQALIGRALGSESSSMVPGGGAMRLPRQSGRRPYSILVAPVSRRYPALAALRPAVCVVIVDPDAERSFSVQRLELAFGLTSAEARLAGRLAAGEDLRSAAAALGITYGTARARLATIFEKTGTRRQSELIRIILTALSIG